MKCANVFTPRKFARSVLYLSVILAVPLFGQQKPRIFYSDLDSGPNVGGENNSGAYVTLYGKGFGPQQGSSQIAVGGGKATAYPTWSDSKVTFQIGPSAASGSIVLTTAAGDSNPVPFTVRPGNIYFVSTSGKDTNAGSFGSPWQTLLKARDSMKAGDITYAMNGVSQTTDDGQGWHTSLLLQTGGAAGAPIALVAYPGATVTVGSATGADSGIRSKGGTGYWVFAGLNLRGVSQAVSTYGDNNWRIISNDMTCPNGNTASACLETSISTYMKIYGNNVHDTGTANASALYQGVYFSTDSNHIDFGWNTIANVHGCRGLQVHSSPLNGGGANDPTGHNQFDLSIHDNIIHDTQCDGIILATIDPSQGAIQIYNNIIYNAGKGPNNPEGSGYWSCINVQSWTNTGPKGSGTVEIYNNTLFNCGSFTNPPYNNSNGAIGYSGPNGNINVHIRNNIMNVPAGIPYVLVNQPGGSLCATTANCSWMYGSNNLFYGSGPGPSNNYITNSISQDPLLFNPALGDFHLSASTSPAAQSGTPTPQATDLDGVPLPQGAGYPIGAYAYNVGAPATNPAVAVSLNPTTISLQAGQNQTFTASVTGTTNSAVTWSLSPAIGTLTAGVYTAPGSLTTQQTVVVTARSVIDTTKFATATITLIPQTPATTVGISLSASATSLTPGQTIQVAATVTGTLNTLVEFTLSPAIGTISANGVYTAPTTITTQQTVVITARSAADGTKIATTTITLNPPATSPTVGIAVSPTSVSLSPGQTAQFVAAVTGTSNGSVSWSLNPAVGTISNSGLYTAPVTISTRQTIQVQVTSVENKAKFATASITLTPQLTTGTFSVSLALVNGNVVLSWTAPAGRPATDWIGLSSVDAPASWTIAAMPTNGQSSSSFSIPIGNAALVPGTYQLCYYASGSYTVLARSAPLAIATQNFAVIPSSTSIAPGGTLSFSWKAGTGRILSDVIGLYLVGTTSDAPVWTVPTLGLASGSRALAMPKTKGTYQLRYLLGGSFDEVVTSAPITVR